MPSTSRHKRQRVPPVAIAGAARLTDLPDELLMMIVSPMSLPTQAALERTCKHLYSVVASVPVGRANVSTYQLFGMRLVTPHYSQDLYRFGVAMHHRRLRFLHRLALFVNTPSLSVGPGPKQKFALGRLTSLRHFVLESSLSRQLHSRIPVSAPALTRIVRMMPNLISLGVSDVPNLAHGFFSAVGGMRGLRSLALTRCGLSPSFAAEYGASGGLTGLRLPADITSLKLDVSNLGRAIAEAVRDDHLFLSSMRNLVQLELGPSAAVLATEIWYSIRSIDSLAQSLSTFQSTCERLCDLFAFAQDVLAQHNGRKFKVVQL